MASPKKKRYATHIPLSQAERRDIEHKAKELDMTIGEYVRELIYGKLDVQTLIKRVDLSDGTVLIVDAPNMRHAMKVTHGAKAK